MLYKIVYDLTEFSLHLVPLPNSAIATFLEPKFQKKKKKSVFC
jgi:hypothetical protein